MFIDYRILLYVFIFVLLCLIPIAIAKQRGLKKDTQIFLISAFLTPIIGTIVALLWKPTPPNEDKKKCPFCGELIRKNAIMCMFCGKEVE